MAYRTSPQVEGQTRAYRCAKCGARVELTSRDPLPAAWRVNPPTVRRPGRLGGLDWTKLTYHCGDCAAGAGQP